MDRRQDGTFSLCGPWWGSIRTCLSREWDYSLHSNQTVDLHASQLTLRSSVSRRPFWAMREQPSSLCYGASLQRSVSTIDRADKCSIVGSHVHNSRQCWTACLCYLDVVYAKWLRTRVTATWDAVHPAQSRIICVQSFSKGMAIWNFLSLSLFFAPTTGALLWRHFSYICHETLQWKTGYAGSPPPSFFEGGIFRLAVHFFPADDSVNDIFLHAVCHLEGNVSD